MDGKDVVIKNEGFSNIRKYYPPKQNTCIM